MLSKLAARGRQSSIRIHPHVPKGVLWEYRLLFLIQPCQTQVKHFLESDLKHPAQTCTLTPKKETQHSQAQAVILIHWKNLHILNAGCILKEIPSNTSQHIHAS